MGWLEERSWLSRLPSHWVSIPLWDDWKKTPELAPNDGWAFQFHYGMIGSIVLNINSCLVILFQFHYGMIGRREWRVHHAASHQFQFHYGMIGRTIQVMLRVNVISFQFHYGMIGSKRHFKGNPAKRCFNSTMGWLEVIAGGGSAVAYAVSIPLWDDWKRIRWRGCRMMW